MGVGWAAVGVRKFLTGDRAKLFRLNATFPEPRRLLSSGRIRRRKKIRGAEELFPDPAHNTL
jgi:hypothetical protein